MWADHLPAIEAWEVVSGQWRLASVGGGLVPGRVLWVSLDAAAAKAALDLEGMTLGPGVWSQVQAIADGARGELNK